MSDCDLKSELANARTAHELVQRAWNSSAKNTAARQYMAGMLDALRYAKQITYEEYDALYGDYVIR